MTIRELLDYNSSIKTIIDNAKDVSALVKYKLLTMCKQIEPVEETVEKVRLEIINKYGTKKEDGSVGIWEPARDDYENDSDYDEAVTKYHSNIEQFQNDMNSLLNSESDITIKKFKSSEIFDAGLPADYLLAIYNLIEE